MDNQPETHAPLTALRTYLGEEAVWRLLTDDRCTESQRRVERAVRQLARTPDRTDWTLPSRPIRIRVLASRKHQAPWAAHDVDLERDGDTVEIPIARHIGRIKVEVGLWAGQTHTTTWEPDDPGPIDSFTNARVWIGREARQVHVTVHSADDAHTSHYHLRLVPGSRPLPGVPDAAWRLHALRAARVARRTHYPVLQWGPPCRLLEVEAGHGETDLEPMPCPDQAELDRVRDACRRHWRDAAADTVRKPVRLVVRIRRHKEPKVRIRGLPEHAGAIKVGYLRQSHPRAPAESTWELATGPLSEALFTDARDEANAARPAIGRRGRLVIEHDWRPGGKRTVRAWKKSRKPVGEKEPQVAAQADEAVPDVRIEVHLRRGRIEQVRRAASCDPCTVRVRVIDHDVDGVDPKQVRRLPDGTHATVEDRVAEPQGTATAST